MTKKEELQQKSVELTSKKKTRRQKLDKALRRYIKAFSKKHDTYLEFAVSDDLMGVLLFGDHYFNITDIIYDIDTNQDSDMIYTWYDATLDRAMEEKTTMNYESWCRGLRYEDLDEK